MTNTKEQMTFTPEQRAALDLLESTLDIREVRLGEISRYIDYPRDTLETLEFALVWYKRFKIAETLDFDEIDRLQRIERDRIVAERSYAVRESVMLSALTGMFQKLVNKYPSSNVLFEVTDSIIELSMDIDSIAVTYSKENFDLSVAFLNHESHENFEVVDGSRPFREQSEGFNQLLNYIGDVK